MKLVQRLVKISEAKDVIEKMVGRVKDGEDGLKETLAKNIETVKLYKGKDGVDDDTQIPLTVEVEETPAEANEAILKELAEIKKSVGELKPSIESLKKETTATNTLALVNETIDGMVVGLTSLKDRANAGTGVTVDELTAVWPGYETRELISGLLATLNNMQKAADLFKGLNPSLESIIKDGEGDGKGGDDKPPEGEVGSGDEGGDDDGSAGDGDGKTADDKGGEGKEDGKGEPAPDDQDAASGDGDGKGKGDDADDSPSTMDLSPPLNSDEQKDNGEVEIEG